MTRTGRPPTLDKVVRVRPDGARETAAEVIVFGVRMGLEVEDATKAAQVDKVTLYNWKNAGARAHEKLARGERLTAKERRYADFLNAIESAYVEFEERCLGIIHRAGAGGHTVTETHRTTRQTKAGEQITELRTVEKVALPQWQASAWLLERRRKDRYSRQVEVTGRDGKDLVPPAERAGKLADSFEAYLEAQASAAEAEQARNVPAEPGPFSGE